MFGLHRLRRAVRSALGPVSLRERILRARQFVRRSLGPRPGKARLLVLGDSALGHTTVQVRGLRYRSFFLRGGWVARFADLQKMPLDEVLALAKQADLIYALKVATAEFYRRLRAASPAKLVFDLTDALWRPPHTEFWGDLEEILRGVDAVFSLTDTDTAYARQYNNLVLRIPVCTSVELFDAAHARRAQRRDGRVVIGWVGSRSTFSSLQYVRDALDSVGAKYPQAELRVVGAPADFQPPLRHLRCTARPQYDEAAMVDEILGMDVGLYPPPLDLEDYRIRGPQKALLYMTGRVPPVIEAAGDWTGLIKDGVTGMVAAGPADWSAKLEALVSSSALRARIGQNAYEYVREGYSLARVFGILENALLTVMRSPSGRTAVSA